MLDRLNRDQTEAKSGNVTPKEPRNGTEQQHVKALKAQSHIPTSTHEHVHNSRTAHQQNKAELSLPDPSDLARPGLASPASRHRLITASHLVLIIPTSPPDLHKQSIPLSLSIPSTYQIYHPSHQITQIIQPSLSPISQNGILVRQTILPDHQRPHLLHKTRPRNRPPRTVLETTLHHRR